MSQPTDFDKNALPDIEAAQQRAVEILNMDEISTAIAEIARLVQDTKEHIAFWWTKKEG